MSPITVLSSLRGAAAFAVAVPHYLTANAPFSPTVEAVAVASVALSRGDFTNAGHGIALILGMAAGSRFGAPRQWTPTRLGLLAVATGFGYLLVGYNETSLAVPAGFGAAGALVIWAATTLLRHGLAATTA